MSNRTKEFATQMTNRMDMLQELGKPLRFGKSKAKEPKAQEWLYYMGKEFEKVGDLTDKEKVSVCLRHLTDDLADQAYDHDTFESYEAFKKWMCNVLGMPEKPVSVTKTLLSTVQTRNFKEYGDKFKAIYAKNWRCEYPRAPIEIKETFIMNMRNKRLREILSPLIKTKSLIQLIDDGQKLIDEGEIKDFWHPVDKAKKRLRDEMARQKTRERDTDAYIHSKDHENPRLDPDIINRRDISTRESTKDLHSHQQRSELSIRRRRSSPSRGRKRRDDDDTSDEERDVFDDQTSDEKDIFNEWLLNVRKRKREG